ncbi:hypothetical protein [Alteribacillus sp. HJP-4]|uniref:hypothetical protein n=1 Tax=Alteribacillus sp. HJP-4 TaxID=2775394 RepID=UPI0035CCE659
MDQYYEQVQIYLNMDEEIEFTEFRKYYQDVIKALDGQAEDFREEDLWKSLFVVESIMSNAENRAKTVKKSSEAKKYKKMAERTKYYAQHFTKRLHDLGYDQDQIAEKFEKMLRDGEAMEK